MISQSLRQETMLKIYQSRLSAESAVWWSGDSNEVGNFVQQCRTCSQICTPPEEPMIATELPDYPWQKIGADLFELEGVKYMTTFPVI